MNTFITIARTIRAALMGALGGNKPAPPAPRAKLNGRRGYGDNDITPPGS